MQIYDKIWCANYQSWGQVTSFEGKTTVARLYCGMTVEFDEVQPDDGYWYVGNARPRS